MSEARDMLLANPDKPLHQIIREVADKHGLTYAELMSHRRDRAIAWPRQEAMYRCAKETSASLPMIARIFNRDHTTIIHGVRAYSERMGAQGNGEA